MAAKKIRGKDLKNIGYKEGPAIGMALETVERFYKGKTKQHKLDLLKRVLDNPALYQNHENLQHLAQVLLSIKIPDTIALNSKGLKYMTYGIEGIEQGAIEQMETAMKLPVTIGGALMADAHQGYGLPIGGVLATRNAVIPYGVGVDIGCRMCLSVYDLAPDFLNGQTERLKKILVKNTKFGLAAFKKPQEDELLDRKEFDEIPLLNSLKDKAYQQIGSSGGGNHFVEFGLVEILPDAKLGIPGGIYLALLSHSGSRGMGAMIARHYTQLAMEQCKLAASAKHLAWLDLDSSLGQEYWQAMTLAGDYASANHHHIHRRISQALAENPLIRLENHHNFAWKEKNKNGEEMIVHRKGATPAGKGDVGIIPGTMTSPGFIVRGKGQPQSFHSASHGAGRLMSRRQAKLKLNQAEVDRYIRQQGIELIGSGLDEAPMVYKDIHQVMAFQKDLVDILGKFTPRIVRMSEDKKFREVD